MSNENEVIECALRLLMNRKHTSVTLKEVHAECLTKRISGNVNIANVKKILMENFAHANDSFWLK